MRLRQYTLIDLPSFVSPEKYEIAISTVCSALMNHGKIRSVYRIGSVSAPGISDLDMVVIFKDNTSTNYDPRAKLFNESKYLFVHPLFGACESHFNEASTLTHFHNYRLIGGDDIYPISKIDPEDDLILRRQTALEFMIKMLFVMTMQKKYRIIKVRSFLLEARALEYDLQFLGLEDGPLAAKVEEIISLRKNWFLKVDSVNEIENIFEQLLVLLKDVLSNELSVNPIFSSSVNSGRFAGNVRWQNSPELEVKSWGIPIPAFPAAIFSRKYFNLESRLTKFLVKLPVNTNCPNILIQRNKLSNSMAEYNRHHIPNFMPLTSGLRMI